MLMPHVGAKKLGPLDEYIGGSQAKAKAAQPMPADEIQARMRSWRASFLGSQKRAGPHDKPSTPKEAG